MTRTLLIAIFAAFALTACAQQRASAPALFVARDVDSTLYLYGTIHLRRAGEPWGSPAVEAALAASDEIWTELEVSPQNDALSESLVRELGVAPAGRGLSTWLNAEQNQRLRRTARQLGMNAQSLEPMQPWLAGLTLTMAPMLRAGYDPGAGVDRAIDAFGDAHAKRMRAFETPAQQLGLLAGLSPEVQSQMLLEAIDEADQGVAALDQMSEAWERGDIEALANLLNEDMARDYPEVFAALITRRNQAWLAILVAELEGAGVDFVAVGAAHLVGDGGLVAQLRARGVRVERVSP